MNVRLIDLSVEIDTVLSEHLQKGEGIFSTNRTKTYFLFPILLFYFHFLSNNIGDGYWMTYYNLFFFT